MKKLRQILKAAWRNARARLEAVPAVIMAARWLGALRPIGWSVSVALIAVRSPRVPSVGSRGFVVAVMGLVAMVGGDRVGGPTRRRPLSAFAHEKNDARRRPGG